MNFLVRHRIVIFFSSAAVILLIALFWPEPKKPGEMQKYYTRDAAQLLSLRYRGIMNLSEKNQVKVDYEIVREENPFKPRELLYSIHVHSLTANDAKLASRVKALSVLKKFYAGGLVRSIVQDWVALDFYYILPHEIAKDGEYGLANCENLVQLKFKADQKEFCIGAASQGDTRRYILDRGKDKLLITPDYTIRRLLNNIFAQREQLLIPHGAESFDLIELAISPDMLKKYPLLAEKTGGRLRLRMLVKKDEPAPLNVWHVENLLSIKPSHAAEFAQLLIALRLQAIFIQDALPAETSLTQILQKTGLPEKTTAALSGSFLRKQTDKTDILLSRYALFAPGVRPAKPKEFQIEGQAVKPLDTLAMTAFNAGYLSADNYPRFVAILQKWENDLREAMSSEKKDSSTAKGAQSADKAAK